MNKIQYIDNNNNFDKGYFILNSDKKDDLWDAKNNFCVTLPYENTIKKEIIKLIRNSKSSLKICSFILTDRDIFNEIENILEESKVAVFILTQLDKSKFSSTFLPEEEFSENTHQTHLDMIKRLYAKGGHIRATQNAHAKFVISDRINGFIMSANITTPSLISNPESGVYINDTNTICHLDMLFDIIFQYGTEYTKFITADSTKQFIVSRDNKITEKSLQFLNDTNLRYTFESITQTLYQEFVFIIQQAKSDIFISTYSIVGLENLPEFVSAIQKKISEGILIHIFARGMNYRPDHIDSCTELAKYGCKIYGDIFNHSKGIFTKEKSMLFTANIDGNHGLINGFEVGIVLTDNQSKDMEAFIKWQISTAPYKFINRPMKKDLFEQYSYYCDKKDIFPIELPKDITIRLLNGQEKLVKELNATPCYLKVENMKITQIQIGKYSYLASYNDGIISIKGEVNSRKFNIESYLFTYENINITFKE